MKVAWTYNKRRNTTLMGDVVEDTSRYYVVKVTSSSEKRLMKLEGTKIMVLKTEVQVVK